MPIDLFSKTPLSENIPAEMLAVIAELKKAHSQEECLKKAYGILTEKYRGSRIKTYTKILEVFKSDLSWLWNREGFLHCTNMNYVLRVLLVESGFFKEDDLKLKWTLIWYFSPHQYIQVNVDGKWIDVDIWAHAQGINFRKHARGFY